MKKMMRSRDTVVAVKFDPEGQLALPEGVVEVVVNGGTEWWWRSRDYQMEKILPGEWLVTSANHGFTTKLSEDALGRLYEDVPDAGEGGG